MIKSFHLNKQCNLLVITALSMMISCSDKPSRVEIDGTTQGTYYHIVYYDSEAKNYQPEIEAKLKAIDMSLSVYNPNSLISRINNGDTTAIIDDYLRDNLMMSATVYEQSDGAFDVTAKSLFDYYGFGNEYVASHDKSIDNSVVVDSLLQYVGFDKIMYDSVTNKLSYKKQGVTLNFNAIAQGYTTQVVSELLDSLGVSSYIVDIGGEIYAKGRKPDGKQWMVGIEKPSETLNSERTLQTKLPLENMAIATSGSYRKYYEVDGKRFSHCIDPRIGYPVTHNLLSVSVIHKSPALADAWATTFMVVGIDEAAKILSAHPEMEVYVIYQDYDNNLTMKKL